jgi:serine/threonine protein kinase
MTQHEFQQRYTYNSATDKLGEGGFGSVFKAYDTHRDRWVALKIAKVNPDFENIRLRREVEMVNQLPSHPNIAYYEECYTFASFDGEYDFGILQYYEQGNLSQLLKNNTLTVAQRDSVTVE